MTGTTAQSEGILLSERFIPTPTAISPEARAFLANPMFRNNAASPAPDDIAGWKAYIAAVERGLTASMQPRVAHYPADIIEHRLSNCILYEITPHNLREGCADRAVLDIHGGAFIVGGGPVAALGGQLLAGRTGLRCYSLDYRMPPDHPFPAAVDDSVEALRFVLDRHQAPHVALHGGSAGANLVLAAVVEGRDAGLPLPSACVLHSPGSDMTEAGDSFQTNAQLDVMLGGGDGGAIKLYIGGHDLTDPRLSPIFADYTAGFPPTILTSGTRDLLLSNTVLLHRKLRRAGITAELHVWEAMCHGLAHDAPEAQELLAEQVQFIHKHLGVS